MLTRNPKVTKEFTEYVMRFGVPPYDNWELRIGNKVHFSSPVYIDGTSICLVHECPIIKKKIKRKDLGKEIAWYVNDMKIMSNGIISFPYTTITYETPRRLVTLS